MASAVVLPLDNESDLSGCSFWCLHLYPHLEGQGREVWKVQRIYIERRRSHPALEILQGGVRCRSVEVITPVCANYLSVSFELFPTVVGMGHSRRTGYGM